LGYEGTNFSGWQRQTNRQNTIQAAVEMALAKVCAARINTVAAGRTDAGVHARVQVIHADIPEARLPLVLSGRFPMAMNSNLPASVRVYRVDKVDRSFHAQRQVVKKTYLYFFDVSQPTQPWLRDRVWALRAEPQWLQMQRAAALFEGTHDFRAFCDADASTKTFTRTLFEARLEPLNMELFGPAHLWVLRLTGNGFLKHMVRSIAGTLIALGQGQRSLAQVEEALYKGNRSLAGRTAPASGLWLWDILYLT
jgi:tRNA pseudouridine38-40 synthase